jgi:hypothetical protein
MNQPALSKPQSGELFQLSMTSRESATFIGQALQLQIIRN